MTLLKRCGFGLAVLMIVTVYPQISFSETFKSSEFLTWKPESQSYYIRVSVRMAALVSARQNKVHSSCIDRWYFSDPQNGDKTLLSAMRKNAEFHPQAIIVGMIQKECGNF